MSATLLFLYFKMSISFISMVFVFQNVYFYLHKSKFIGKRSYKYRIMLGRRVRGLRPPYQGYLY